MPRDLTDDEFGLSNGLVPSVLTQFGVAMWSHQAHNELSVVELFVAW